MNIRFTSSLTPDDENMLAPAVLRALAGILDLLPIAYMLRIDTTDAQVYQHSSADRPAMPATEPSSGHRPGMDLTSFNR
ncbi:MAG: hypothetical protein R2752_08975 [Vicinamibacterales bacterium]